MPRSDDWQQASPQLPVEAAASIPPVIIAAQALPPQTQAAVQAVESSAAVAATAVQAAPSATGKINVAGAETNAAPTSSQGSSKPAFGKATASAATGQPNPSSWATTVRQQAASPAVGTSAERVETGPVKTVERGAAGVPSRDAHKAETDSSSGDSATGSSTSVAAGQSQASPANSTGPALPGQPDASALASVLVPANIAPQAAQPPSSNAMQSAAGDKRDSAADTLATSSAGAPTEAHALPSINTAKVLQSMQGSEMRVGMHSAEFGNLSINTSVNRQSIAAQISFEHMDLGKAITAHLPSIEAKLSSDYGMHARVEVRDQSMGSAADSGRGESRRGENSATTTTTMTPASSVFQESGDVLAAGSIPSGLAIETSRLDIQA